MHAYEFYNTNVISVTSSSDFRLNGEKFTSKQQCPLELMMSLHNWDLG